ncbi:protein ABHD16A-like [Lingula anatina]|uniref:Protein ABHD16A-like n=1 Tax=Lingula anatina TaxID=7574 RepID=A0A1S3J8K7_LINAN|nr:protein ABHD16A-like [Lingula anatina]|eukprot:XP_013406643.1 protein ABHD16A-like [Lingula anatina]
MFIDRRDSFEMSNGKYLVVCSEGNAGFYEIGCMVTPMDAGYSVLGWNHPGFSGSTGAPFPEQEQNAVDTVMQYAITKLGFKPEEIILFAWSIGGFPASFAAMNYPDVKAVILDATFDDVMPLAVARMPQSWRGLVSMTVRRYLNIPISSQLCQYPGPVLLIRRTNDEMITTVDQTVIGSNRGNDLLIKLLQYRYPNIVNSDTEVLLRNWLECKNTEDKLQFLTNHGVDDDMCEATFASFVMENSLSFPMQIGEGISEDLRSQLALFLAYKHMEDFESTHCTPLPTTHFKLPWQPKLVTARNFDDVD